MDDSFNPNEFYERLAKTYPEELLTKSSIVGQETAKFVESWLDSVHGSLLDIGCNKGYYSLYYAHGHITGLDIAPTNILVATQRLILSKKIGAFHVEDIIIPFDYGQFDNILFTETLEHLPKLGALVDNIWKALKVGGECLITCPSTTERKWVTSNRFLQAYGITDVYYHGGYSLKELISLFDRFKLIKSGNFNNKSYIIVSK